MAFHIGIVGPIATVDIAHLVDYESRALPVGYTGAPFLATLIGELLRRGHKVSAFTLSSDLPLKAEYSVKVETNNFAVYYVPMRPRAWPFNGIRPGRIVDLYAFERRGLSHSISQANPDVLHAHWCYEFAWASIVTGLPIVVTAHDSPFAIAKLYKEQSLKFKAYRWLRAVMAWHVLRQAKQITTVSPYMVEAIRTLCRVPVRVIPNPVTEKVTRYVRTASTSPRRILLVSNGWGKLKNAKTALLAFKLATKRIPELELEVCGHDFGVGETAWQWWNAQNCSGNVIFRGAVSHGQILATMAKSDLLVHPSLVESFGAVLAEAIAIGLPVIAGENSGAIPWVVGEGGLLVDVTDPEAIADAIVEIVSQPDKYTAATLRAQNRVLSDFGKVAVTNAYEREYQIAINRSFRSDIQ